MNMEKRKKQVPIVKGVVRHQGRLLVVRRHRPGDGVADGKVEFPGGKVDHDESPEVAVIRETKEEAGYDAEVKRFLAKPLSFTREYDDRVTQVILLPYELSLEGGEADASDKNVKEVFWATPEELEALHDEGALHPGTIEILRLLDG